MKISIKHHIVGIIALACVYAGNEAFAASGINNDAAAPSWRGLGNSTVAKWTFDTTNVQNALIPPDSYVNPYVSGQVSNTLNAVEKQGSLGKTWKDSDPTWSSTGNLPQGCWILGKGTISVGSLAFSITNNSAAPVGTYQYIQVADTWYAGVVKEPTNMLYLQGTLVNSNQTTTGAQDTSGNNWYLTKTIWRLPVYAASTAFKIIANGASGSTLDAVIVDVLPITPPTHTNITRTVVGPSPVTWTSPADGTILVSEVCNHPSGSTFAIGQTTVYCTNTDLYAFANVSSFVVQLDQAVVGTPPFAPPMNMAGRANVDQLLPTAKIPFHATTEGATCSFFDVWLDVDAPVGCTVSNIANNIVYHPPSNWTGTNHLLYSVRDSNGLKATNTITVVVTPAGGKSMNMDPAGATTGPGGVRIILAHGIPNVTYGCEVSPSLQTPVWTRVTESAADSHGVLRFTNSTEVLPQEYYRTVYP